MSAINTNLAKVAVGVGSTWGTAIDLTSAGEGQLVHVSNLALTASRGQFTPRDNGFDNFINEMVKLEESVTFSITMDMTFEGIWKMFAAALFGTVTQSPTENNVGEGDYAHDFDLKNTVDGDFLTMAWLIESDQSLEFPSAKIGSMQVNMVTNQVAQVTFTGIADKIVAPGNAENDATDVSGLSYPDWLAAAYGDTNHYFRLNAQSGGALSNSDDLEILNCSFTVNRPFQTGFPLRGANTRYTVEPDQLGRTTGNLQFQLFEIDDSNLDLITEWKNSTEKKAEIFIDGSQIASGDNRSTKFQFCRLDPAESAPSGFDIPGSDQLMQPQGNYSMLQASAAPTGMTGVTNYLRMSTVETRDAAWDT